MIFHSFLVLFPLFGTILARHPLSRHVDVVNESGDLLSVFWIKQDTKELVKYNDVANGGTLSLNSFVNHTFLLREGGKNETCESGNGDCHVSYLTIEETEDQVVHVKKNLELVQENRMLLATSQAEDVLSRCQQLALAAIENDSFDLDQVVECMEGDISDLLEHTNEQLSQEVQLREEIADLLENYTCADNDLPITPAKEIRHWRNLTVNVLHERASSQIHVLEDFITDEECQAIEEAAEPILHRGTVADGSGGSRLSDHRKAWQAGISIPWEKEEDGDPIARVVRRLYDYTNHATSLNGGKSYNLSVVGQEDLMSIQYFESPENESPDQYRPHCDGDCDGLPHKMGGRVATMVMYCDVPERGGGTNFGHANVYVKPTLHAAAFFSYMNPETMIKDTGFTTHSGCPVTKGTKRIAVQWMRIGVDEENPWDSFNTLTISKKDCED